MKVRASFLWLGLVHCSSPADKPANGTTSGSTQPADTNNATDDTNDSGGDARVWTTFAGNLTHLYGQGRPEVRDYSCQLYWTVATEAAPTVVDDCPDCDFAFAVQWTLDTILSRGSGGPCDGEQNGDFTQLVGFRSEEDLPGTYTGWMLDNTAGTWTDRTMATFDATTGAFVFSIGDLDEPRAEGDVTVFDTDRFYGSATVWDGSPRDTGDIDGR